MTPREKLPPLVLEDIERYQSYHWKPGVIEDIVYRRHGLRVTKNCLKALAENKTCPRRCEECCWAEAAAPPMPELQLRAAKHELPTATIEEYLNGKR